MDMLIDGGRTGASDGAVDPVFNPGTIDQIGSLPRFTLHEMSKEGTLLLHEVFGAVG
jgi:hypothetical protein